MTTTITKLELGDIVEPLSYTHVQDAATSQWVIEHKLQMSAPADLPVNSTR